MTWWRLALIVALLGAFAGMGWRIYSLEATLAEERQARAEDNARAERERATFNEAVSNGVRKATDAYIARANDARRSAAGLDAAYRGVLDAINEAGGTADDPAAACRTDAGRADRLARLLAEGAGLATAGGGRVEDLAAKLAGLQDHARAIAGAASQVPVKD